MPGFNIRFDNQCNDTTSGKPRQASRIGVLPSNYTETARAHRFRMGLFFSAQVFSALAPNTTINFFPLKITRPSVEIDTITIHNGQDEIFRPGKHHHQPIEADFYETVDPAGDVNSPALISPTNVTARALFGWWYDGTLDYSQSQLREPTAFNSTVNIVQEDGIGQDIWNYWLYNAWPDKVTPKDLDYSDSNISLTTVRIKYNKIEEYRA